jgi:hypothetical protein
VGGEIHGIPKECEADPVPCGCRDVASVSGNCK